MEDVHGIRSRLNGKGISTTGGEDLDDSVVHGASHGSGVFVVGEAHTEVTIHCCLV